MISTDVSGHTSHSEKQNKQKRVWTSVIGQTVIFNKNVSVCTYWLSRATLACCPLCNKYENNAEKMLKII